LYNGQGFVPLAEFHSDVILFVLDSVSLGFASNAETRRIVTRLF